MPAPDDLAAFYDTVHGEAEHVVVQGATVAALFDTSTELELGGVLVQAPALRLPASVAAAEGGACTVRGQAYVIRQVQALPPSGVEQLLVLARA
jgi:hypothetical protein